MSKLASTRPTGYHRSVVEKTLPTPFVVAQPEKVIKCIHAPAIIMSIEEEDWRQPLLDYKTRGVLPADPGEAKKTMQTAVNFCVIEGQLFKKGISTPLLKCIPP